jgi:hypothetical protein
MVPRLLDGGDFDFNSLGWNYHSAGHTQPFRFLVQNPTYHLELINHFFPRDAY